MQLSTTGLLGKFFPSHRRLLISSMRSRNKENEHTAEGCILLKRQGIASDAKKIVLSSKSQGTRTQNDSHEKARAGAHTVTMLLYSRNSNASRGPFCIQNRKCKIMVETRTPGRLVA